MSNASELSVREIEESDIELITNYWQEADAAYLVGMGVDLEKMPTREEFKNMLLAQLSQSYEQKQSYCITWLLNNRPVGHSNINRIEFGKEAYMHLHLWYADVRKKGIGSDLVSISLPYYFRNFRLEKLYCEPYALNPAPSKVLEKVGFDFVREYTTVPGSINFEQPVKRWKLSSDRFKHLIQSGRLPNESLINTFGSYQRC